MRPTPTGITAAAVLLAALGCASAARPAAGSPAAPAAADTTPQPPVIRASPNGVLRTTLTIRPGDVVGVGDTTRRRNLFTGPGGTPSILAPTLRLNPGDSLDLTIANHLSPSADTIYTKPGTTNFHFHGFNVNAHHPHGDQVVTVAYDSGATHRYAFRLPESHPVGMHWYHPHLHHVSSAQVGGGLSGVILVGDVRTRIPGGADIPERVLLVKDFQPWGPNHSGGSIFTINGEEQAQLTLPSGGREVWHVGNVGADTPMGIKLVDERGRILPLVVLGRDGNPVATPETADSLPLWPGERYSLLIQAPNAPGTRYAIVNTDSSNAANGRNAVLGYLTVTAGSGSAPGAAPAHDTGVQQRVAALLAETPDTVRTFVFSEDQTDPADTTNFWINNEPYDHRRIDVILPLGRVEDWVLVNQPSGNTDPHVFHIHQGDFIVTESGGRPVVANGFQDRVNLPTGERVVVRIPFTDDWQAGLYVFHCHLLFHEDHGMMKNVCVYPPGVDGKTWCQRQLDARTRHQAHR